ncbi:MAG: hypothetical protein OXK80_05280, partial [Bdellovibrionales bacterium]|nr:hypothetical protein [Bdellovibrionales bacterium]
MGYYRFFIIICKLICLLYPSVVLADSKPERQLNKLTLEETRSAIQEYNKTAPEGEEIVSERSYSSFRHKIGTPVFRTLRRYHDKIGTPVFRTLRRYHEKQFGTSAGLAEYLFPTRSRTARRQSNKLTLEETRSAIQEYNKTAPEGEEITSKHSYSSFRDRIPRAPSIPTLYSYHEEQFGTSAGLAEYLFPARSRPARRQSNKLTLEETRSA